MAAKRITVLPQKVKLINPYGNLDEGANSSSSIDDDFLAETSKDDFAIDLMSPLSPQMKGTFMDKLPSWNETSKAVNPDTFLNVDKGNKHHHQFAFSECHIPKAYLIPPRKSFPSKCQHGQISRPFGRIKST
jgi:hypothetical protein